MRQPPDGPKPPRPPEQRAAAHRRYLRRRTAASIVKTYIMVPVDRVPELRAITLAWRQEAKLLLETDRPSAEQILQIHGVSRALDVPLPVAAFATRATAAAWLAAQEAALGSLQPTRARVQEGR